MVDSLKVQLMERLKGSKRDSTMVELTVTLTGTSMAALKDLRTAESKAKQMVPHLAHLL